MKLYRKQLNSLEELKREYIRLNYERKQGVGDLLPHFGGERKPDGEKVSGNGILGLALGLLNAKSPVDAAMAAAGPVMSLLSGKNKKGTGRSTKAKGLLGKVAKEVLIGYLTGKGVQLAARGITWYLKQQRVKKQAKRADVQAQKMAARK